MKKVDISLILKIVSAIIATILGVLGTTDEGNEA